MRILIVTDTYPPNIGGATRAAYLLAHCMTARGHVISVATTWQPGLPTTEDDDGVSVHRVRDLSTRLPWLPLDPLQHHTPPYPDPETVLRLRRLINRFRPDVVHSYGWLTYSCAVALLGKRIPLLLSARDYSYICGKRTFEQNGHLCDGPSPRKCLACATAFYGGPKGTVAVAGVFAGRPLLRRKLRGFHSVSSFVDGVMRQHLLGLEASALSGAAPTTIPIAVLPSFRIDPTTEAVNQDVLARLPSTPYILFVGALRRVKGIEPLLAAHARLTNPVPLVLIGPRAVDTPEFPPDVTVLNDVPWPTVMAAWDRALFGVAPSVLPEALGNVVHEAMSRGKAVIGTAPSGMSDMIIDGETGFLVPAGDVAALTAAMQRLLDDPLLRERMGKAGQLRAQLFTADAVLPRFEALYHDIVGSAGTPCRGQGNGYVRNFGNFR